MEHEVQIDPRLEDYHSCDIKSRGFVLQDGKLKRFSIYKLLDGDFDCCKQTGLPEGIVTIISVLVRVKGREVKYIMSSSAYHAEIDINGFTTLPFENIQSGQLSWNVFKSILQSLFKKKPHVSFDPEYARKTPPIMRTLNWAEIDKLLPSGNSFGPTSSFAEFENSDVMKECTLNFHNYIESIIIEQTVEEEDRRQEEEEELNHKNAISYGLQQGALLLREMNAGHPLTEVENTFLTQVTKLIELEKIEGSLTPAGCSHP
jgi:hypothetical protein